MFALCFVCLGQQEWHCGGNTDLDAFQAADTAESEVLGGEAF